MYNEETPFSNAVPCIQMVCIQDFSSNDHISDKEVPASAGSRPVQCAIHRGGEIKGVYTMMCP